MFDTGQRIMELKAELATLDVPYELLRNLRILETHTERMKLQARRLALTLEADAEVRRLQQEAEELYTRSALGETGGGQDEIREIAADAQGAVVARDLQMLPVEASIHLLEAECDLLESDGFTALYDAEALGKDLGQAVDTYRAERPESPEAAAYTEALKALA